MEVRNTNIYDPVTQAPTELIGTLRDITDRKYAEDVLRASEEKFRLAETALKQALAQEKELGELKTRFVSMASHEFRTPLAAILATTETLTGYRDRMDKAQIDARLDKIRLQVNHMKIIIDEVLQLAWIQAGRIEFKPEQGNPDMLCREIIEEFDSQTEYRGRISYTHPDQTITVRYDNRLLREIISNIVHNALKYSPSDRLVHMTLSHDEGCFTLKVTDEGIGIPASDLQHLFEPFHPTSNVGAISGTGLGLSIARQAVELHGGTITVESDVDRGTTFRVVIPVDRTLNHDQEKVID